MSRLAEHLTRSWQRRGLTACLLWPLSALMGALVRLRRWLYQKGWLASAKPHAAVLVVGNRIVGGAGKTPTTIAILQHLRARGFTPGVLTRGYKAQRDQSHNDPTLIVDASSAHELDASHTGDEPLLIWRRTQCPIAIDRDRVRGGQTMLQAHPEINILVCDDGLQHLRLQRDIEVVVFDERGQGNGWLLPAGPLREPIDSPAPPGLKAAPIVLYNASHASTRLAGHTARRLMSPLVSLASWWGHAEAATDDAPHAGALIHAMAGIAQPERFFEAMRSQGFKVQGISLPDHADLGTLPWRDAAIDLVVTEKDAIKLKPERLQLERPLTRIWVAGLDFQPEPSFWATLDAALARLPLRHPRRPS